MSAASSTAWSLPRWVLWLVLVTGVALGVGGLVGALDHPPGDATRPELTARQDRAVAGTIDSLAGLVGTLADDVAALRSIGRDALVHAAAGDVELLRADIAAATALGDRATARSGEIELILAELPTAGAARSGLSELNQAKLASVESVLAAVMSVNDSWQAIDALDQEVGARVDEALIATETAGGALEEARQLLATPIP